MYRLFYDFESNGDVLFVVISPEKKTDEVVSNGDVTCLFANKELVGINIFNVSRIAKLKSHGAIFAPDSLLLETINNLLSNSGAPKLEESTNSGFKVLSISNLEEHPLDEKAQIVTLKGKDDETYQAVSYYKNLSIGKQVVCALDGTILYDGSLFSKKLVKNIPVDATLCSGKELKVSDSNKEAFIPEGYNDGEDFFYPNN